MDKQILLAVMERLQQIEDLRWIEPEEGQLYAISRPPIELPACLIDLAYNQCETLHTQVLHQRIRAELRLTLVFGYDGEAYAHAPNEVKNRALARYDIIERIHSALQGWTGNGLWTPMSRQRVGPSIKRQDSIKVFEAVYTMGIMDEVTPPTTQNSD